LQVSIIKNHHHLAGSWQKPPQTQRLNKAYIKGARYEDIHPEPESVLIWRTIFPLG